MIQLNKQRKFEFTDVIQVKNEYTYRSDGICAIRQKNTALLTNGFYHHDKMVDQPFYRIDQLYDFEYETLTLPETLSKFKLKSKPISKVTQIHSNPDIYIDAYYTPTEPITKLEYNVIRNIVRINDDYLIQALQNIYPSDLLNLKESEVWLFTHETLPPRVFSSKNKAVAYVKQYGGEINSITMEK